MKILIATGGSGGHIFPALKVAQELASLGHEVIFAGNFGVGFSSIERSGFSFHRLSVQGFRVCPVSALVQSVFLTGKSMWESLGILKKVKPDAVCGFGGFSSLPVVIVAALLKYPTIIHEQNVLPGKANKLLSMFARKIAITFVETEKFFPPPKTVLTGCPTNVYSDGTETVHRGVMPSGVSKSNFVASSGTKPGLQSKDQLAAQFHLDSNKLTILVLGGSQGSHRINTEFINAIRLLREHLDFQVIHLCGKKDLVSLENQYRESGVRFRLFDFLEDIGAAYSMADLVVSRAGAVTVLEIAQLGIPAVLVPYPFAGGHQIENAKILMKTGATCMIEEKDLTSKALKNSIIDLITKRPSTKEILQGAGEFLIPDSAARIAQLIVQLR